jgi:hypothetical protein
MPLSHRVREAGKVHFMPKQINARRVVFSLLRAYFEMLKQELSKRALNYSKQLDADLAATDALDHQRSGRPFPITPARIGARRYL